MRNTIEINAHRQNQPTIKTIKQTLYVHVSYRYTCAANL